jgi:hypothetical protein
MFGDCPPLSAQIFQRAHERGEIDLGALPKAVPEMPFDLIRHDLLMTLKPLPRQRIESIVDDLFMPIAERSLRGN